MARASEGLGDDSALQFNDLTFTYNGAEAPVLERISLEVGAGEFVLLAGRSGSGKTSLLRAGCGLVPHFHGGLIEGEVRVAGRDTREFGPGQLADVVGYVAQDPETQVISTTVAAELDLPLRFRGYSGAERARAIEEVALALNIPHLLDRSVSALSGGELQRVALAVALAPRPPLILLDEPTSQLDPVSGDELIWLLRRLNEEWGVAVVLAEHRIERCLAAADRVVVMDRGRVRMDGSPAEFLRYANRCEPALATPGSRLFNLAGIDTPPVGVRDGRMILRQHGYRPEPGLGGRSPGRAETGNRRSSGPRVTIGRRRDRARDSVLRAKGLWVELDSGEGPVDVLRDVDLEVGPGERIALMGRNGAGKSTLLRTAAGLGEPAQGRLDTPEGIALLTQSPDDYLVRERVGDELSGPSGEAALRAVGLRVDPDADPRDLAGGERQRLALAIALAGRMDGAELPGLVALDEPTRGLDRSLKDGLAELIGLLSGRGAAVIVATHDVEFAAAFADRVLLLGAGELIADAAANEVLSGGWYFATEIARMLDRPGVITVEQGAGVLLGRDPVEAGR